MVPWLQSSRMAVLLAAMLAGAAAPTKVHPPGKVRVRCVPSHLTRNHKWEPKRWPVSAKVMLPVRSIRALAYCAKSMVTLEA